MTRRGTADAGANHAGARRRASWSMSERVRLHLRTNGGAWSIPALAAILDCSRAAVAGAVVELHDAGELRREEGSDGRVRYRAVGPEEHGPPRDAGGGR